MERIGLAGLTLHDTDVEGLEGLRRALDASPARCARELADELAASELVLIATCNRVEVVYARESGHRPGPPDRARLIGGLESLGALVSARTPRTASAGNGAANRLWIRAGRDAVHHLLRVACSLDSLVVGEAQIQGQVRDAFERARAMGLVGDALAPVFEAALQVGKQVRSETSLARHPVSVVSLGVQHLAERLGSSERPERAERRPRIALLGAGHMGELAAHALADHGLELVLVANRTLARAEVLAAKAGARAMELDAFRRELPALDGLVSATGAPEVVLDAAALNALARRSESNEAPFVAVDLAVPKDLEPTEADGLEVVGLDHLRALAERNRRQREEAARAAETLVERKLEALDAKAANKRIADVVARTLEESTDLFEHELERVLGGKLAHLDERSRRTVERWARSTFGRLAHAPVRAIKELSASLARQTGAPPEELGDADRRTG